MSPIAHIRTAGFYRQVCAEAKTAAQRVEAISNHRYFINRAREMNSMRNVNHWQ